MWEDNRLSDMSKKKKFTFDDLTSNPCGEIVLPESSFPTLLPVARKVTAKLVGLDLVPVGSIGGAPITSFGSSWWMFDPKYIIKNMDKSDAEIRELIHKHCHGNKDIAIQFCIDAHNSILCDINNHFERGDTKQVKYAIKDAQLMLESIQRIKSIRVPRRKPKTLYAESALTKLLINSTYGTYTSPWSSGSVKK